MEDKKNIVPENPEIPKEDVKGKGEEKKEEQKEKEAVHAEAPALEKEPHAETKKKCLKPKGHKAHEHEKKAEAPAGGETKEAEPGPETKEPEPKPEAKPREQADLIPQAEAKPAEKESVPTGQPGEPEPQKVEPQPAAPETKEQPPPVVEEPIVGQLELSILKDLEEANESDLKNEAAEYASFDDWYLKVKGLYAGMPEAIKSLEAEFAQAMENTKKETAETPITEELQVNLENRLESLDLCLKMLRRLDRFYPRFASLQEKVETTPALEVYIWDKETNHREMKLKDFPTENARLKKEIEKNRDQNYRLLRLKKGSIDELKNFFFEFMQNYFFPIIDGLDKGRKFFQENQAVWMERFAAHAGLIQSRFKLYDLLIEKFNAFLGKFHIELIPAKEGDPFDEKFHEPFMVEKDEKAETGQIFIKEVSCKGYKFIDPEAKEERVIRLPQVIVVKK